MKAKKGEKAKEGVINCVKSRAIKEEPPPLGLRKEKAISDFGP